MAINSVREYKIDRRQVLNILACGHCIYKYLPESGGFFNGSVEPYSFRLWSVRVAIPAALSICSADSRSLTRKTT